MSEYPRKFVVCGKDNPFASEMIDAIPFRFPAGDWASNLPKLAALNFHGSIVGPKGSGKTTLLEQLQSRLNAIHSGQSCFMRIPVDRKSHGRCVTRLLNQKRSGAIVLVDASERLSITNRVRLMRTRRIRRGGLVLTLHRRCRFPVWVTCSTSQESLQYVLSHVSAGADPLYREMIWSDAVLESHKRNGNVREVLRFLYDRAAEGHYGKFNPHDSARNTLA